MAQPRLLHVLTFVTFIVISASLLFCPNNAVRADQPRVSVAYTAWDDYYFYAAFEVNDEDVVSTNRTPVSQPQEDDDVEVFFNVNPAVQTTVRTPETYQMAVSAGSGAYFSQGDGTKIPKAKLILTYKYAVTIDGTLNNPNDNDTGFTVELAIPWQEMGLTGPPAPGQVFGFNAISRNRESLDAAAQTFVSLSPNVLSRDDIQNPSKWTKIQFISTLGNQVSNPNLVYCPRINSDTQYPVIDGVVRVGEWNTAYGYSFGNTLIAGAAPTHDEEPNITESPFATLQQPVVQTPQVPTEPASPTPNSPDYSISLPGGGAIHVGTLKTPSIDDGTPGDTSPGRPDVIVGPEIGSDASLALIPQSTVAPLIVAPYSYSFSQTVFPLPLMDQPVDGIGPAFGGDHSEWHKNQLIDARRAGIDVLLVNVDPTDPDSSVGLAALAEAMKELEAEDQDYPLLGVKVKAADAVAGVREFLTVVPPEFRAEVVLPDKEQNQRAYIVFADTLPDVQAVKAVVTKEFHSSDTVLVTTAEGKNSVQIATVSPGGWSSEGTLTAREQTNTLNKAWENVFQNSPNWVYVDSFNDYARGTEIAASRQYGEQYVDAMRSNGLKWAGADQWDAKYLQNDVPTVIAQKTIYTVSIRVENNGSLPWRAGEEYALSYRWYKNGRLYDDTAPKLPLSADIYPGESTTVKVGLFAQNSSGIDIEPGLYTLVFDMVQGQDRWFSYVGERPLAIPVRVEDPADAPQASATVLSSTTPVILDSSGTYTVKINVRNEGQETWLPANTSIALAGNLASGSCTLSGTIYPGAIGTFTTSIRVPASETPGKIGELDWTVTTPGTTIKWVEHPLIVQHDLGASFAINNVPSTMKTGDIVDAKVAVINDGPYFWKKASWKIGYEWLYLDGVPAVKEATAGAFDADADPGSESAAAVELRTPNYPGRYQLVLDLQSPDGATTLAEPVTRERAVLPVIVTVTEGKNPSARTVDLTKYFTGNGEGSDSPTDAANFDGAGGSLPAVHMPPDGTIDLNADPLLAGRPGPPLYPSGYYSFISQNGSNSNHRIAFLFGAKGSYNMIASHGQRIDLPSGTWKAIHILAASTGAANTVVAKFVLGYSGEDEGAQVSIANWTKIPDSSQGTVAIRIPYHLNHGAVVAAEPVFLSDYSITVDPSRRVNSITLPSDPAIKILAITVEK